MAGEYSDTNVVIETHGSALEYVVLGRPCSDESDFNNCENIVGGEYGLPLNTPAWQCTNVEDFLSMKARGKDIMMPYGSGQYGTGVLKRNRRVDALQMSVEIAINGDYRPTGVAHTNVNGGLHYNMASIQLMCAGQWLGDDANRLRLLETYSTNTSGGDPYGFHWWIPVIIGGVRFARIAPNYATAQISLTAPEGLWYESSAGVGNLFWVQST